MRAAVVFTLVLVGLSGGAEEKPNKCGEKEFMETRANYEVCASSKIREIGDWLGEGEDVQLADVCAAVNQLLHTCGEELGWCFTQQQVEETKQKQREGLKGVLEVYFEPQRVNDCIHGRTGQFGASEAADLHEAVSQPAPAPIHRQPKSGDFEENVRGGVSPRLLPIEFPAENSAAPRDRMAAASLVFLFVFILAY